MQPYTLEKLRKSKIKAVYIFGGVLLAIGLLFLILLRSEGGLAMFLMFSVLGLMDLGLGYFIGKKNKKILAETDARFSNEYAAIEQEMNSQYTYKVEKQGAFITPNYVVTCTPVLQVARITEVQYAFGARIPNNSAIALKVRLADGTDRVVAIFNFKKQADEAYAALTNHINYYKAAAGQQVAAPVLDQKGSYYYAPDAIIEKPVIALTESTVAPSGEVISHSRGLGLLGAVLGALLGTAAWVLIAQLGGLGDMVLGALGAGVVLLTLFAYKLLGKGLDRTGALLSIGIAALVLAFGCFALFVISVLKAMSANGMGSSLSDALLLTMRFFWQEGWVEYFKVVGIVYFFSALFSFGMLRKMFTKKPAVAQQVQGYSSQPPYGTQQLYQQQYAAQQPYGQAYNTQQQPYQQPYGAPQQAYVVSPEQMDFRQQQAAEQMGEGMQDK